MTGNQAYHMSHDNKIYFFHVISRGFYCCIAVCYIMDQQILTDTSNCILFYPNNHVIGMKDDRDTPWVMFGSWPGQGSLVV
jgi:hypothetical protein